MKLSSTVLITLSLGAAVTSRAALLAHEPFTNSAGTAIIASDTGFGFSGAWQANSSGGVATNTSFGLGYTDSTGHTLTTAGGAGFFQGLTSANTSMQPNRPFNFTRATNGEAANTWISLILVRQGPTNGTISNPYARGVNVTFDYPNSSSGANQRVGVGNSSGAATNTLGILSAGGNLRPSVNPPAQFGGSYGSFPLLTNFIVLRIDHLTGTPLQANDNAYLWVNPPNLALEPALGTATTNVLGQYDYSIGLVRVFVGGQDTANNRPYGEVLVDEIRVGETYADVTPYGNATPPQALTITNIQSASGSIVLSGAGGPASATYHLLASANLTTVSSNWPVVATNTFDANGNFALTNPLQPGVGAQFYRVRIPGATVPVSGPSILSQPLSVTVTQGQSAAFNVTAAGTAPLSYQWYFNTNTSLSGQTASNLTLVNVQSANAGTYSVRVSNASGNLTSTQAILTVLSPPAITTQPQSQTAFVNSNVTFIVAASGTPTLSYQWFFNTTTPLANQTNASLTLLNVATNNAGTYGVFVSNAYGSTNSAPATLTVNVPNTNGDYYISTNGSDANPGTLAAPFATLTKAASVALPGNVIFLRGGTYLPSATIRITNAGTAGNRIQLLAYPGEKPYFNFTNQPVGDANRGLLFTTTSSYWNIQGLEVGYAGDNGIKVEGSYLRFEQCVFHHNGDTGLQIGFGHTNSNPGGLLAAYIEVVNCDSYLNFDLASNGGNADGFAAKMHCGQGIVFIGCRAWENSDDGWDLFETDHSVVISNCWTWKSAMVGGQGNGNGFKMGGNGAGGDSKGTHYAYNCVAFSHKVNGFTQNSHKDGNVVIHCLSFTNGASGYNYFFEGSLNSGKQNVFKNNVGIRRNAASTSNNFIEDNAPLQQNNSWNLAVTANTADYVSLLEAAAKAPRNPDGSLPTGFARLVSGSDLIDQGINVGLPFTGAAPDLGPYEFVP